MWSTFLVMLTKKILVKPKQSHGLLTNKKNQSHQSYKKQVRVSQQQNKLIQFRIGLPCTPIRVEQLHGCRS
uniref:Uncharacterized protein n=1 Tax=Arundo donax TaxID=35708 RepID=A0A0A9ADN1_ARUDO